MTTQHSHPAARAGRFQSMGLRGKLVAGFGVVIVFGFIGFWMAAKAMRDYLRETSTAGEFARHCVESANSTVLIFHEMDQATMGYVFSGDKAFLERRLKVDEKADASFQQLKADIAKLPHSEDLLKAWDTAQKHNDEFCTPVEDKMLELLEKGKNDEAKVLYKTQFAGALEKYTELQNDLADKVKKYSHKADATMVEQAQKAIFIGWVLQGFLVAGSILIALLLARSIAGRLKKITSIAQSMAQGECDRSIDVAGGDEIGQLGQAFGTLIEYQREIATLADGISQGNLSVSVEPKSERDLLGNAFQGMVVNLRRLIGAVAKSASGVSETSQNLASMSQQTQASASEIADASEKLAASAGEASSIMEELMASIETVASSSQTQTESVAEATRQLDQAVQAVDEVSTAARSMAAVAKEGSDSVQRTIDAMHRVRSQVEVSSAKVQELDHKGQEIGDIVETIERIAEQTNLLALNAAIEAARAGQHGRGFAVVADEVRKLAEQAGQATNEIGSLIQGVRQTVAETVKAIRSTDQEVQGGAATSQEAGDALKQIVKSSESVVKQAEQVSGLATQVDKMMSEVSSAASDNQVASSEMARGAEKGVEAIATVANVGVETARGAETLNSAISIVSHATGELSEMSFDLQNLVGSFRVESEDPPARRLAA